jgi:hypothetical protein
MPSQTVLGQFPDAPQALLVSIEADVFPRADPAKPILIDGAIGDAHYLIATQLG